MRVITWLPVGGIERKILAVLPRLDRRKFRVRLVCLRERGPLADALEEMGVPVDLCPLRSRLSPSGLRNLARLMRRHGIDVVHAHMYRSNVPATIAARLARVPVVIAQVHNVNTWETRRQRWVDRFLCRWRTVAIAVSERVRQDVIRNLGMRPERVVVIRNGVHTALFADRSKRGAVRRALGLEPDDLAIIYHGRLTPHKNPQALLKIAREAGSQRSGVVVLVAGDGPLREDLEVEAKRQALMDRIVFLGRRDDIPELLQAADIAVLPSLKEGFSNALIEAMAAGLPVIATDVGGNAEAIEHGRSGLIVPPRDERALLGAVLQLVDDPMARETIGRRAAERARDFSLDKMVEEVESLYLRLAAEAGLV
jgi:glycosyltransferase involved in cell wall biosynthesis